FLSISRPPPAPTPFPYTTLFRSRPIPPLAFLPMFLVWFGLGETSKVAFIGYTTVFPMFVGIAASVLSVDVMLLRAAASLGARRRDRKSTRLNSSHGSISYAVFCL